jgi:hypothetical protein
MVKAKVGVLESRGEGVVAFMMVPNDNWTTRTKRFAVLLIWVEKEVSVDFTVKLRI